VHVPEADARSLTGQRRASALGVDPGAVVGHAQRDVAAEVDPLDRHQPACRLAFNPVAHRVLDQRLQREHRQHRLEHLGVDLHTHLQALAEARLLEPQVLLDIAQLVGDRRVRALARERVPDELGELGQQLARLLRARVDERRDGGERVVDEVRRDLGAQRAQLGTREPLADRLHLRELDHGRDERGNLADHAGLFEPQPAGAVVQRHERAHPAVLHHERRDDRGAQRARRLLAVQPRLHAQAVVTHVAGQRGKRVARPMVVVARAVERQQPLGVGERHRARTGEHPQVRGGGRRAAGAQPAPQVRQQRRRRVHGALHRRARRVEHARRAHEPPPRDQRGRERQTQQHTKCDVHPRGRE
jgi:hypothetical protein